ncbi:unnamed protein product [Mytilus edulis]|uniref:WD repeat-containing protein 76 n=1 Tax=Mytilus edulis TaxID=6550 RepID=A0A8S3RTM8_MYTED|nr:unnamed protein product [Mytilus edulis]
MAKLHFANEKERNITVVKSDGSLDFKINLYPYKPFDITYIPNTNTIAATSSNSNDIKIVDVNTKGVLKTYSLDSTCAAKKPSGTLEMAEYLGFNSSDSEHDDLLSKMKGCFKCKIEKSTRTKHHLIKFCGCQVNPRFKNSTLENQKGSKLILQILRQYMFMRPHQTPNTNLVWLLLKCKKENLATQTAGREFQTDCVVVYAPHSRPINCLKFSLHKPNQLYSCSYDGTVRCCDLQKGVFEEIYSTPDEVLLKSFDFMTVDTLLVAQQDGCIALVDTRTSR